LQEKAMQAQRIQTVLRLPQDLMDRIKRNARKESISFNSYVERILLQAAGPAFPTVPEGFTVSEDILSLGSIHLTRPTSEELEADPKLAYLWEKYGEL